MPLDMSTLMPGMNPSGTNQAVPGVGGGTTPAMGGASNPFLPSFPTGTSMPGSSNPMLGPDANMGPGGGAVSMNGLPGMATTNAGGGNALQQLLAQISGQGFGANGVGSGFSMPGMTSTTGFGGGSGGFNLPGSLGFGGTPSGGPGGGPSWTPNQNDFIKAMHKAGFSAGDAALLYNFIASGAGFNQGAVNQVLGATFAAQQPQINRGEADILEHFGSMGLGMSSPAAIGLGDYLSQVSLGQGQLAAQTEMGMYEQSVADYLSVLMGGKGQPPQNMFQNLIQVLQTAAAGAQAGATAAAG